MREWLWELLFPRVCVGCGKAGGYVCETCLGGVARVDAICPKCARRSVGGVTHEGCRNKQGMDGLTCVFRYEGVVRRAISRVKYGFRYRIIEEVVEQMMREMRAGTDKFADLFVFLEYRPVVVPVPAYWVREKWRGFNQAEVIAGYLGGSLNLKVDELLIKRRNTEQVGKGRVERRENARGVYEVKDVKLPSRVMVVDDVWTTGATMRECCRVLKERGVGEVWGMTVCR